MSGEKPEYYYKGGYTTYKEGVDPEVTCWHCGKTFLCDCTDATCRLCGAPWAKERCKEFNFVPKPKTPDSKVEVKACPIKVVYERFKHMDKLLCDPLIRKQYNGENDPYHLTLFDLWDAIKEHQSTPIANNGVSLAILKRIIKATPHSMCSDAEAWAIAEQLITEGEVS